MPDYDLEKVWQFGYFRPWLAREHKKIFPYSIASQYLECIGNFSRRDSACMRKIIETRCPALIEWEVDAAIHAMVETPDELESYQKTFQLLKRYGRENIVLVSENNNKNIGEIILYLAQKEGLNASLLTLTPDEMLCLFARTDFFIGHPRSQLSHIAFALNQNSATIRLHPEDKRPDGTINDIVHTEHVSLIIVACIMLFVALIITMRDRGVVKGISGNKRVSLACFIACFVAMFLFPLVKPSNTIASEYMPDWVLSRRLNDFDCLFALIISSLFVFSGVWWINSTFFKTPLNWAVMLFVASTYLVLKATWDQQTIHLVSIAMLLGSMLLLPVYTKSKLPIRYALYCTIPAIVVVVGRKLFNMYMGIDGSIHRETLQYHWIIYWSYFSAHVVSIVTIILFIIKISL